MTWGLKKKPQAESSGLGSVDTAISCRLQAEHVREQWSDHKHHNGCDTLPDGPAAGGAVCCALPYCCISWCSLDS